MAALLLAVTLAAAAICAEGLSDRLVDSDLAIVPGNTVNPDGKPSPLLQGRLDAALGFYRSGHCKFILVSGGIGVEGFDEAQVMKAYLVANGVAADRIIADNQGRNSFETARFAAGLIRSKNLKNPVVISQFFHISRMRLALAKQGVTMAGNVHSQRFDIRDIYSTLREIAGYVAYSVK
ncbi:YdcF family protein [Undibacterium sp.]|uniref:YdcF family protein n=1 Tax=Undibacterium sp. TaxID=1914977 RepID=UPI00374CEF26